MFTPKGNTAEWRLIYNDLKSAAVGDTVTYSQLDATLGRTFRENRSPLYEAVKRLERDDRRTVENVGNVGYRVVQANEHIRLAKKHHTKAKRSLRRSLSKAQSADRTQLTSAERVRIDAVEVNVARQAAVLQEQSRRLDKVEAAVQEVRTETRVTDALIGERLARLEASMERAGLSNKGQS